MAIEPISPATEKRLALLFSPPDQETVRKILIEECGTNIPFWANIGLERLRFAVLKLSDGNLAKLRKAIDLAKSDWRDVLVGAGFADDARDHLSWFPKQKDGFE